jgi:branched-chain amino acid transport system substrate-binding protein
MSRRKTSRWKVGTALVGLGVTVAAVLAVTATARTGASSTPIKLAILSDCEGAFGAFYEQDIGGAQAAFAQFAGGKAKNRNKPSAGMTGITVSGRPIQIVGYGCSNDTAPKALAETRRLMERLKADILIGPLSGDEGIAVANYAKRHPTKTFINGTSGAQDTTLKVRAPNFFRFNSDGAQWSAGLGDYAYNTLKWRNAAVIADDYSFAWTSSAGQLAEFCAVGGKITKRVYPPLNTTDYSSFVRQLPSPSQVDGYFWAVGGAGLTPSLKAFEQAKGPIKGTQFAGNLFWSDPTQYKELSERVVGALASGPTWPESKTATARAYVSALSKAYDKFGSATPASTAPSVFVYNYYNAAWGLIKALKTVKGDISGGQARLRTALRGVQLNAGYGKIRLDQNRNAVTDNYVQQLQKGSGGLTVKTILRIPAVDQSFGGTFSPSTPPPGRTSPSCSKRSLPWIGKAQKVG